MSLTEMTTVQTGNNSYICIYLDDQGRWFRDDEEQTEAQIATFLNAYISYISDEDYEKIRKKLGLA